MAKKKQDSIDKIVAWGCQLLHLDRHTKMFQQLAKFVIVGCTNTAINWAIYFNYWASTTWVFDTTSKKTRCRLFVEFTVFNGFAFLTFDEGLLWFLIYPLGWNYMLAKVVTTACGMVFNFITRKMFLEDSNALKAKLTKNRRKKR